MLKRLASITSSKGHRAPEKASEEERRSAREQIDELAKKTTSLIGMADLIHVRRLGEGMPLGAKPGQCCTALPNALALKPHWPGPLAMASALNIVAPWLWQAHLRPSTFTRWTRFYSSTRLPDG